MGEPREPHNSSAIDPLIRTPLVGFRDTIGDHIPVTHAYMQSNIPPQPSLTWLDQLVRH